MPGGSVGASGGRPSFERAAFLAGGAGSLRAAALPLASSPFPWSRVRAALRSQVAVRYRGASSAGSSARSLREPPPVLYHVTLQATPPRPNFNLCWCPRQCLRQSPRSCPPHHMCQRWISRQRSATSSTCAESGCDLLDRLPALPSVSTGWRFCDQLNQLVA